MKKMFLTGREYKESRFIFGIGIGILIAIFGTMALMVFSSGISAAGINPIVTSEYYVDIDPHTTTQAVINTPHNDIVKVVEFVTNSGKQCVLTYAELSQYKTWQLDTELYCF